MEEILRKPLKAQCRPYSNSRHKVAPTNQLHNHYLFMKVFCITPHRGLWRMGKDNNLYTMMSCKCHNLRTCIRCQDTSKHLHANITACCHFLASLWFAADSANCPDGAQIMSEGEAIINVFCFSQLLFLGKPTLLFLLDEQSNHECSPPVLLSYAWLHCYFVLVFQCSALE